MPKNAKKMPKNAPKKSKIVKISFQVFNNNAL